MQMTGDKSLFSSFTPKMGGFISYGDNNIERIIDYGTISKYHNPKTGDFLLFEGLKPNFLSII